jgi:hypothetical protein
VRGDERPFVVGHVARVGLAGLAHRLSFVSYQSP